jgi:hypothetical protein
MNDLIIPLILVAILAALIYWFFWHDKNWPSADEIEEYNRMNMTNQTDAEQNICIDYYALYIKAGIENIALAVRCTELAFQLEALKNANAIYQEKSNLLRNKQVQTHGKDGVLSLPIPSEYVTEYTEAVNSYENLCNLLKQIDSLNQKDKNEHN